jgi:CDP-paratose 2-epimerase
VSRKPEPKIGLMEWFRPGEYERVESVLAQAKALGIREMRTTISWADWYASQGDGWYAWLLPRLAVDVNVLPCFLYTPPSLGVAPKYSSPPKTPKAYADFIDVMITSFGNVFEWIELWNRPNYVDQWDRRMDPDWRIFTEMVGGAAYWIRKRGKKAVLPALFPTDLSWLDLMEERGVLSYIDAVGVHGFPSTTEFSWSGWDQEIGRVRNRLIHLKRSPEIWVTQTGFSTWRGDERAQVRAFAEVIKAPVERVYWQSLYDRPQGISSLESAHSDERDYHNGLIAADDSPKLLFRLLSEGGVAAVHNSARPMVSRSGQSDDRHLLITGGAGFIGTNLADRLLGEGQKVTVYDNLSRPGVEANAAWLKAKHGERVTFEIADVRDAPRLSAAVHNAKQVFHFAAQVAVTSSVEQPRHDYEVNIGGTLNLLEAIRAVSNPPSLVFTSTNKVYGALADVALQKNCTRYQPLDTALRTGISEDRPLAFHSPYGCSKGAADQYVLDYARTYGISAVVFRMSCIYGLHQMGTEDQGWIAHFLLRAIEGAPILLCGDGMQVRDVLYAEDLVDAFLLAQANIHTLSGQAFNIGGGLGNTTSLLELLDLIHSLHSEKPDVQMGEWRVGDQRYYVSDTRKFKAATGWAPKVSVRQGVERLYQWLVETRSLDKQAVGV